MSELLNINGAISAELDRHHIIIDSLIAKGTYGIVYRGRMTIDTQHPSTVDVAVKVCDITTYSERYRVNHLPAELHALENFKHPFAIHFYEQFQVNSRWIVIVLEYAPGGTLQETMMNRKSPVPQKQARKWFTQMVSACHALHTQLHMAHRDIKMENLLIDSRGDLKLADYGFAKVTLDPQSGGVVWSQTYCGTLPYLAPEMVSQRAYLPFLSDIWALGVVLFIMNTRRLPFSRVDKQTDLLNDQMSRCYRERSEYKSLPASLKDLIDKMLEPNENGRISMEDILKHEWVTSTK